MFTKLSFSFRGFSVQVQQPNLLTPSWVGKRQTQNEQQLPYQPISAKKQ